MSRIIRAITTAFSISMVIDLSSCALPVAYKPTQKDRTISQHYPCTVKVAKFEDKAPKETKATFSVGPEKWHANYINAYRDHEYAAGISNMVATDLAASGLFARVLKPDSPEQADYELRATIWDFSAIGKCRPLAENAMILSSTFMSLPGALIAATATSQMQTDVITSVILTDIRLVSTKTEKTVWTCPPLHAGGQSRRHWSRADVPRLVTSANEGLRDDVTQLINRLSSDAPKL
jgi:hypothetical protein